MSLARQVRPLLTYSSFLRPLTSSSSHLFFSTSPFALTRLPRSTHTPTVPVTDDHLTPFDAQNADLFSSLVQSHFSLLSSSPFLTSASIFPSSFLESSPSTQLLAEWVSAASEQGGARSYSVTKHKDGKDGEWKVEVYAQDQQSQDEELRRGKIVARAEGKEEEEALKRAADKALELITAAKAIEGKPETEQKKVEANGDKNEVDAEKETKA
ncbi:hypothetical protein JCM8547_006722 [Rhodosporidiobolus lusitaniae]